jgi:hypothetical protein
MGGNSPESRRAHDRRRSGSRAWYGLLAIPFVALLWVPFYNSVEPRLGDIPFFYWYQFLWVILTSAVILGVYARTDRSRSETAIPGREDERP